MKLLRGREAELQYFDISLAMHPLGKAVLYYFRELCVFWARNFALSGGSFYYGDYILFFFSSMDLQDTFTKKLFFFHSISSFLCYF